MKDAVLKSSLCKTVSEEVSRKEKEFNCIITLYMGDDETDCEMDVLYLDPVRIGGRKQISITTNTADIASGIIKYFKEVEG